MKNKNLKLDLCFYDVMITFKGERTESAEQELAQKIIDSQALAGQYTPLSERGVTALNYMFLGTPENKAVMADPDGRLANTQDLKQLLTSIATAVGASIVYVTKLHESAVDLEEFADIEDATAARDLVFRQARSVAVGKVSREWAQELSARTYQDVHLDKSSGQMVALVDGGLDITQVPVMEPASAFVYTTPLATLVRLFLPGRSMGEAIQEVNFTWFGSTRPLRSFPESAEAAQQWNLTLERLHSASGLVSELKNNPAASVPSDAEELWSSEADLSVVESVLTAAGLPGRLARSADRESRAEYLPHVQTIRASSVAPDYIAPNHIDLPGSPVPGSGSTAASGAVRRAVVEEEISPVGAVLRCVVFAALTVFGFWAAATQLTGIPQIGLFILAVIMGLVALSLGARAYQIFRARRH